MKPSRAMITGEISWAWVAFAFAWAGSGLWPFQTSHLHFVLHRADHALAWSLVVGLPALALMFVSAREFAAHRWPSTNPVRRWSIFQLERSAMLRGRLCLVQLFSWLYVGYLLLKTSTRPSAVMPVAIGGAVFMLLFWIENRRVQRDIRKQTAAFRVTA